jgi:N-acetylglucosamine kinase-like BadF-type ATPase
MAFYLALDVGGTKTDYLLADETRELARVRTGTIKRMRTDASTAAANLDQALAELTALSGVSPRQITRTCIGTAGETVPLVTNWLREAFAARVSGDLVLLGDVEIALDAAFHGGVGVLAMAGTGSNVAGRMPDGTLITAGGWGPELADQVSGHKIGREGARAAFLARDEQRPTILLDAILDFWQLASLDLLVEYANSRPSPDFSRLTEVILRCASEGDAVAAEVLRREGEDLAHLVRVVIRRIQAAPGNTTLPSLAFTGSIMEKVQPVRDALIAAVRTEFPALHTLDGVIDPIAGALWRARTRGLT